MVRNALAELDATGWSEAYGNDRAAAEEDLQEILKRASANLVDAAEAVEKMTEAQIALIDEMDDKLQQRLDRFEAITDQIDHYTKILEMTQGEESYDNLIKAADTSIAHYQAQQDLLHQALENYKQGLQDLERIGGKYTEE